MYTLDSFSVKFNFDSIKDCIMTQQTSIEIDGDLSQISDSDLDALRKRLDQIRATREEEKRRVIELDRSNDLQRITELQKIIRASLNEIQELAKKHDLDDIEVIVGDFSFSIEDGEWVSSFY